MSIRQYDDDRLGGDRFTTQLPVTVRIPFYGEGQKLTQKDFVEAPSMRLPGTHKYLEEKTMATGTDVPVLDEHSLTGQIDRVGRNADNLDAKLARFQDRVKKVLRESDNNVVGNPSTIYQTEHTRSLASANDRLETAIYFLDDLIDRLDV